MFAGVLSTTGVGVLGDPGDLGAAPGSRPWATAVRIELIATLDDIRGDADHLARMSRLMREHQGYRRLADAQGRAFGTYEAFCVASRPFGLGYEPRDIEAIITERRSAQAHAQQPKLLLDGPGPMTAEETKAIGNDITNRVARRGTDSDYLTARIARDRPDILERMQAGEFKSVRAAAREAGLVKPQIRVPSDPAGAARALCKHFSLTERAQLIAFLLQEQTKEQGNG